MKRLLSGEEAETAWALYEQRFAALNTRAVQRHLMTRAEFHYVCQDGNVEKWRVFDDHDQLVGLATYTNVLESMPLVSPAYFAARYPEQYAAGQVWYCGFVCIANEADSTTFLELITRMYRQAAAHGGVISLDFCRCNDDLARLVKVALTRLAGGPDSGFEAVRADTQTYWVYVTPRGHTVNGVRAA
ncbi:hypothetical protein ABZS66_12130 [Dactylosporangium sp. NPDC005572]|uniref:hypothetical protein n=1 Tax=Dactylosporangium sp. NPDC005572 TaxID=3156889 RepID=UPI0033A3C7CA